MQARTSQEWWAAIKQDSLKLEDWLKKQYRGEVTAVERLTSFCENFVAPQHKWYKTLQLIREQEKQHARWIQFLLESRGFSTALLQTPQRYWEQTLPQVSSFQSAAAASAYAETMRLERIRLIAEDATSPRDILETFQLILPQEVFHSTVFTHMAGEEAMQQLLQSHRRGVAAISLIPATDF